MNTKEIKQWEYVVYDKEDGKILHIHSEVDIGAETSVKLGKNDVLTVLSDFFPNPEKVDVLAVDMEESKELYKMRVNPKKRMLEPIQSSEWR